MHEYSLAYEIYSLAKTAAIENHAKTIRKITLDLGKLTLANPDQIRFLFDIIREDDPLFPETELEFHEIPVMTGCSCGYTGDQIFVCPVCGSSPSVIQGRGITITSLDVEVGG